MTETSDSRRSKRSDQPDSSDQAERAEPAEQADQSDRQNPTDQDEQRPWYFGDSLDSAPLEGARSTDETVPIDPIWAADELPESWKAGDDTGAAWAPDDSTAPALPPGAEPDAILLSASASSHDDGVKDVEDQDATSASARARGTSSTTHAPRSVSTATTTSTPATAPRRRYGFEAGPELREHRDAEEAEGNSGERGGRRFSRPSMPTSLGGARTLPLIGRIPDLRVLGVGLGLLLILLALLASEAGIAILIASVLLPVAAVVRLDRTDVFDREPPLIMLGISTAGAAAGILIGLLNGVILDEFWDRNAVDRIGAVGFAGELVGRTESPPLAIFALAGILLPGLSIAAMLAAPIAARRWSMFRNEAMDGVLLGAAAGAGFAFGTAVVHLWPLITGDRIVGSVADWTAAVLSMVVFRAIVLMCIAALIALAIWQFDLTRATQDMVVPLAAGLGGAIAYSVIGLVAEQSGATAQVLFNVVLAAGLLAAARVCLLRAIDYDRSQLVRGRVVCPTCRRVTPEGKFCAFCQSPLTPDADPAPAT